MTEPRPILEKLDLGLSVPRLRRQLEKIRAEYPRVRRPGIFGGWSVTSFSGDYRDGWHTTGDRKAIAAKYGKSAFPIFNRPTQLCAGYLAEVIEQIQGMCLFPLRARISILPKGSETHWHRDAPSGAYSVRLHIPIVTNRGCRFETKCGGAFLPADGSGYLVRVNRLHRVINRGSADRYHLIMDIRDPYGKTRFHPLSKNRWNPVYEMLYVGAMGRTTRA